MDISKAKCLDCGRPLTIERLVCRGCGLAVEGEVEVAVLGQLDLEDQVFVTAFLRSHGSIKRMEALFGISYPTVKNRLNRIVNHLDASFIAPKTDAAPTELMPVAPRFLRIYGHGDGAEFDIRIPLALIKTGIKLEAMLPDDTAEELKEHGVDFGRFSGMDADELVAALAELAVSVAGDKGEQIRIHCE